METIKTTTNTNAINNKCIKIVTKLHDQLAAFIDQSQINRTWLIVKGARIYVRRTKRYINNTYVYTFEIASISIDKPYQNKGIFKSFLQSVFILNKDNNRVIYVESVLNDILADYFKRNNWYSLNPGLNCYYLHNPLNVTS